MELRVPLSVNLVLLGSATVGSRFSGLIASRAMEIASAVISAQAAGGSDLEIELLVDGEAVATAITLPATEESTVITFPSVIPIASGSLISARVSNFGVDGPEAEAVSLGLSGNYLFSNSEPPAPSALTGVCRVFGVVVQHDGTPDAGATILARQQSLDLTRNQIRLSRTYADANGEWFLDLPIGDTMEFTIRRDGIFDVPVEIPDADVFDSRLSLYE